MSELGITIDASGALLEAGAEAAFLEGANAGLNLVALQGEKLVKDQLYEPKHGKVSGHLQRSVHGGLVSNLHAQVDAGIVQQGANVVYTSWIEGVSDRNRPRPGFPGYHMFENAEKQLQNSDVAAVIEAEIIKRLA